MEDNSRRKRVSSKRRNSIMRSTHSSKRLGVGDERYSSGIGYVVLASDMGRDSYIKLVYQTATAIIINATGELIKDVIIPEHILRDIVFPEGLDERGSMLSWINVPVLNQVIASGLLRSPAESYPYREWEKVYDVEGGDYNNVISRTWDINHAHARLEAYFGDSDALSEKSGIEYVARSPRYQSKITLSCDGRALFYGDISAKLMSEEELSIEVGSQEGEVSTLLMQVDGTFMYEDKHGNRIDIDGGNGEMTIKPNTKLTIDADSEIKIGENASESAILGDKLVSSLEKLIDGIKLITVPTALGPSGTPINFAAFDAIKSQLNTIKSTLVKIE